MRLCFITCIFLILLSVDLFPQSGIDAVKAEAERQIKQGRYGEAIDLLNRYISAKPQDAEGYNLRGLCYEKRNQYEQGVYDLRSAVKLNPNNRQINENLKRVTDAWYSLLYNKIAGHKREIAINPIIAKNYLEIGKSYKNLGEWLKAEEWYDEYLKVEDASPDEIIRYTEILAKNNHISKGEPLLKRYTENYPDDQRLWSRYGYFLFWLGKTKPAVAAFENALRLKPFFKEAMDGLDQARGKGYIYTINDTSVKNYNYGMAPKAVTFEYIIDRYYRQLKKDPDNKDLRFKLMQELYTAGRLEEAFEQSEKLESLNYSGGGYDTLAQVIKSERVRLNEENIDKYKTILESDNSNKEALLGLANAYSSQKYYDEAIELYRQYIELYSAEDAVVFLYAKNSAWNRDFQTARENLDMLLGKDPENENYLNFKAQLSVWTGEDLDWAQEFFESKLQTDKEDLEILNALSLITIHKQEFDAAEQYISRMKEIDPANRNADRLLSDLEIQKLRVEQDRLFRILQEGREMAMNGNCQEAIGKYDEYMSQSEENVLITKEYADVLACAHDYDKAIGIYNELLEYTYDFEIDFQRAKAYYMSGDSIKAVEELKRLASEQPDNFLVNLYLGDAYMKIEEFGESEEVYDRLLVMQEDSLIYLDSVQIGMINQRKGWIPASGFSTLFGGIGGYMALSPQTMYYADNQNFQLSSYGLRGEASILSFISAGGIFQRTRMDNRLRNRDLTLFKGQIFIRPFTGLLIGGGAGSLRTVDQGSQGIWDMFARYEFKETLNLTASYEKTDGRMILFSSRLIDADLSVNAFRFSGWYTHKSKVKISGYFSYIKISDRNSGNDFQLRLGREFYKNLMLGYEFFYSNYGARSEFYYSPINFESHSIFADYTAIKDDEIMLKFGGRLGYIPEGEYFIRDAYGDINYKIIQNFALAARLAIGSTYRFDNSYNSFSAFVSAYWSF